MMQAVLLELSAPEIPTVREIMGMAPAENFPVAARALSRSDRRHLLSIYGFARLADQLGDELSGDRLAALDWLEREVDNAYAGKARHPSLERLQRTLSERELPREPLVRLIDANRLDQRTVRYRSWEQLQAYCALSANPVGELVLCVFGLATAERIALSNDVCTALQLTEHLQDLREDVQRARIYLPEQDLERFGSSHHQLARLVSNAGSVLASGGVLAGSPVASEDRASETDRLREAIAFETARARQLLASGVALVASIGGRPKLAIAGFVAGGLAGLEGIERARFEVLGGVRRASRPWRVRALIRVLAESRA
jgi:squalene synthase HpnC